MELIVSIAIIGILASILTPNVVKMLAKARDARKQSDFIAISTALYAFYNDNSLMPSNYNSSYHACQGDGFYERSMQELVNARYLENVPTAVAGSSYCYYDYGAGNIGALMVTQLDAYTGTTGLKGSCRPWTPGQDWCDQSNNNYYCVCNTY